MRTTGKHLTRSITVTRSHLILICTLACALMLCAATFGQRPFREYPGWEYEMFPKPPDWQVPGEWVFARLMYPSVRFSDRPYTNWLYGAANWTIHYPPSDRHLAAAVPSPPPIQAPSTNQPINP